DIKTEKKVENSTLEVHHDEKPQWFTMHNVFPYRIERIPVVRLLDCYHIKALLNSTSVKTIQSYKVHCGSLHFTLGQGKSLSSSTGMGQNDMSSGPNIMQPEFPKRSILVEKGMCQNTKNSRCQSRKQFKEIKWCVNLKNSSKKTKMSTDLEESTVQEILSNLTINNKCGLQIEDKPAMADSSTTLETINYSELTSLALLAHTSDFIPEQPSQKQLFNLSSNEKVSAVHFVTCNAAGFQKSNVLPKNALELKHIEPQIHFSNEVGDSDSIMETVVSETIISCNSDVAGCMNRGKRTPKEKEVGSVVRKLQLYSCQRAVPISGKKVWPRDSCARTTLWVDKNHVSDSEFLRGTDLVVNSGQQPKPLTGTSKTSAITLMDHTAVSSNESPNSITLSHTYKAPSAIASENSFSSMHREIPKQCTSSNKTVKKSKVASNSLVKDAKKKGNITNRTTSIDTQNGAFADSRRNKINYQKTSIAEQELLLKTLITGNLPNFKIPLLKDKNESRKLDYTRLSERDTCSPLNMLDDSMASVKKVRTKETSSCVKSKHHFHSEQFNDTNIPEDYNELELSTLEDRSGSLSTGHIEKQMLPLETNAESNYTNNCTKDKVNFCTDVLKAYEEDVLVIDVIPDDPDLFGDIDEQEAANVNKLCTKNVNTNIFSKEKLELEPEFPQLPRILFSFKLFWRYLLHDTSGLKVLFCRYIQCSRKLPLMDKHFLCLFSLEFSENAQYILPANCDHQLKLLLPANTATASPQQDVSVKPWTNGITNLGLPYLPRGYCRSHFNTLNGCERPDCWYSHFPVLGNEKLCSDILKKYISIGEVVLLQRAVQIFTHYYKEGIPVEHLNSEILNNLLTSLLQSCLLKELFHVIHTSIMIKILPTADVLLKVFEHVASMKLRDAVPELIEISCKLVDSGMILGYEHVTYITKLLNLLQVSAQEISMFLSKYHCKEKGDWTKLGTLYINVRRGCENFGDLEKYSLCIANILMSSMKTERSSIPFCEFATAVNADPYHNEADTTLLGRIGISVMFSYYKVQQWSKARKVLDVFHALKINFTFFKGLLGEERLAPRCHIVNVAVEIFLKCGSLDGAIWVLRESDWIINTLSWPCDRMDVLNRHNLLCTIASEYITKSRYGEAFEVLQNLPGFENSCDTLDVSQYSLLFNKLLDACLESKNLGISSNAVEFMLTKNIPIQFNLLRALITALGRSCLWLKARTHYKSALALGCYPPLKGNLYRKLLLIPSYMSEIEMLLAIEIFLVSNASCVQSPGASNQILQIILKRCEDNNVRNEDDYPSAVERLIQAARISSPKLFIKHLTVNINMEQVYTLEYACVLKWLKENMKWAGKVWLF
uniref:Protein TOPAZ1 n=1 Tax=Varanus komodoensis TaxID=61221 RepID=A0A8D2IYV0_VARKO